MWKALTQGLEDSREVAWDSALYPRAEKDTSSPEAVRGTQKKQPECQRSFPEWRGIRGAQKTGRRGAQVG